MKCPSCGAEIGTNNICEYCGSHITAEMQKEIEQLNKVGCPKCGSTNIQIKRENQGEIRGKNSKTVLHQTVAFCKDCGNTWYPNGKEKPRKTWLWVLGWIFLFPLPLTLILLKKKDMKPILKYGIIAAAWILFLVIGIAGNASDKTKSDIETQPAAAEEYILVGEELGEYGRKIILNQNTDLPVEKYLYKLPAGTYDVTTTNEKMSCFFIVKDEVGIDESNTDYPEILQYVGDGYELTAGENDFNGHAQKIVTIVLKDDESIQTVDNDTFVFDRVE